MSQRNLVILWAATVFCCACYLRGEQNPYARYVASALATIERQSLAPVPSRELFDAAMKGMVKVLHAHGDEHSQFFTAEDTASLLDDIRQYFYGIGVRIRLLGEPPKLVIVGPPDPGTPAARARLLPGDHIREIDGQSTDGLTMEEILRRIRGKHGEPVRLTIQRSDEPAPRIVELVREMITVESILGDVRGDDGNWRFALEADPRIAHVRIASFGDLTAQDLARTLKELTNQGAEAVALDLRDNAGGTLDAAVDVCNLLLLPGRLVVETRGRSGAPRERFVTRETKTLPFLQLPLAVLVNGQSASASEIVAACLQDHGRAVVVGQRTFGKGTVQQLIPTQSGKSVLKLTWASFWRPSGANIHRPAGAPPGEKWGVAPDPGLEFALSVDEYRQYARYRIERDLFEGAPPADSSSPAVGDLPATVVDFVDRQLAGSIEHLQSVLDGRRP
jgi:carboxyl-terminal processing protease